MSASTPSVYFVIGTPGSGRRAVVRDLVENGIPTEEKVAVLLADTETADPEGDRLAGLPNVTVQSWHWEQPALPAFSLPPGGTVFFFADPLASVIDQLEALKPWLQEHDRELARILCCVDCQLAAREPVLHQWFAACIRFADVVFLTQRQGVENKWLSDFIQGFKSEFFPCHFIQLRKTGVPNPALVLDPTPRRLTQYFEEDAEFADVEIETDDDEEDGEDADDGLPEPEPYFERHRSGRRAKELPNIRDFLAKK